jgi:hypothetical protein
MYLDIAHKIQPIPEESMQCNLAEAKYLDNIDIYTYNVQKKLLSFRTFLNSFLNLQNERFEDDMNVQ